MKLALVRALFGSFLCTVFAFQPSTRISVWNFRSHRTFTETSSYHTSSSSSFTRHTTQVNNNLPGTSSEPVEALKNPSTRKRLNMALSLIGSTTSVAVSLTFFVFLAWKRDALMVTFFMGSIGNGILSKILKKIINQTRPAELASESTLQRKPTDNGMPSSHAMSLGFIAMFTALCVPATTILLIVYTLVSLFYRIQVNLHTWQQVLVGLTVGATNGCLWHWLCQTTTIMDWVRDAFLGGDGLLPIPMLIVPILLGALTVGSFERRLSELMSWTKLTEKSYKDD